MNTEERLEAALARIEGLERTVAELVAHPVRTTPAPKPTADELTSATVDRRGLLRHAGTAAAGAVLATTATGVLAASPAAAGDGDLIEIGAGNVGTTQTTLRIEDPIVGFDRNILLVTDGDAQGGSDHPAALAGWAVAGDVTSGVYGYSNFGGVDDAGVVGRTADGQGVFGRATGAGAGVVGRSVTGPGVVGASVDDTGVRGLSGTNNGVSGKSDTGVGVVAISNSGPGVIANSNSNSAVVANSNSSSAVVANSNSGPGVSAFSGTDAGVSVLGGSFGVRASGEYGVSAWGVKAAFQIEQSAAESKVPPTRIDNHVAGELDIVDGTTWLSTVAGTPGTWRRLAGPDTAGALTILPAPVRCYDSRPGNNPTTGPKTPLANGATRIIDVTLNSTGVPKGATAILVNITVVNTSTTGYVSLYANGVPNPGTSSINWSRTGEVIANTTVTALDDQGRATAFVPPTSSTDFFLDIIGYFR